MPQPVRAVESIKPAAKPTKWRGCGANSMGEMRGE
jgi:hypothetical protein